MKHYDLIAAIDTLRKNGCPTTAAAVESKLHTPDEARVLARIALSISRLGLEKLGEEYRMCEESDRWVCLTSPSTK